MDVGASFLADGKAPEPGKPCETTAVDGLRVCSMHGAGGRAHPSHSHPNWKHGHRRREAFNVHKPVDELGRGSRELAEALHPLR